MDSFITNLFKQQYNVDINQLYDLTQIINEIDKKDKKSRELMDRFIQEKPTKFFRTNLIKKTDTQKHLIKTYQLNQNTYIIYLITGIKKINDELISAYCGIVAKEGTKDISKLITGGISKEIAYEELNYYFRKNTNLKDLNNN